MGAVIAAIVVIAWLALTWFFWIRPVVDAARHPRLAYHEVGRTRAATISLILLAGWIGGLYYLVRIRSQLIAAEQEHLGPATPVRTTSTPSPTRPAGGTVRSGHSSHRVVASTSRELFVRNIPAGMTSTDTIPPGSAFPPLRFSRKDVVDAVREIDPSADTSQPHRIMVVRPEFEVAIVFPSQDPLSQVFLRVGDRSDRNLADRFISRLLTKLEARAFDTGSATLIFAPPS